MQTKICKKCGVEKKLEEFYNRPGNKDGKESKCKKCRQEKKHFNIITKKQYITKICPICNKEFKVTIKSRKVYCSSSCKGKQAGIFQRRNLIIKKCDNCGNEFKTANIKQKRCCIDCSTKMNNKKSIERYKERYNTDINFKIKCNLRKRLLSVIKEQETAKKAKKSIELLGCDIETCKQYLESKFQKGMAWDNYGFGNDKWHIDHIIPCASFNLTREEEQYKCFHYTNLQPLWQKDNLSKSNKLNWTQIK